MASELAQLILHRFVQRRDVYARQHPDGGYRPVYAPLDAETIDAHLAGQVTIGHYLSDPESRVRVIVFDVDLEKEGLWMAYPNFDELPRGLSHAEEDAWTGRHVYAYPSTPREDWADRAHPGRGWYKQLLRTFADCIGYSVRDQLEIPTLAAYSGSKGVHVYGFLPEPIPAAEARAGAQLVLREGIGVGGGQFAPHRGRNFWKITGGAQWSESVAVEIFPKQDTMEGKKLGNLVRLPLGTNLKSADPTFFLDESTALTELAPADPTEAMQRLDTH